MYSVFYLQCISYHTPKNLLVTTTELYPLNMYPTHFYPDTEAHPRPGEDEASPGERVYIYTLYLIYNIYVYYM
jgi:hypothetical protein